MRIFIPLITVLIYTKSVTSSSGDNAPIYQRCLHRCAIENCTSGEFNEVMFTCKAYHLYF